MLVSNERHDARLEKLIAQCREAGVRVRKESREQLTAMAKSPTHQGVSPSSGRKNSSLLKISSSRWDPHNKVACCSHWTALKTRRISVRCCALPTVRGSMALY